MTQVNLWTDGSVGTAELESDGLGTIVKKKLLRDVVRMYEANARQGTVKTKSRGEVQATTRKPYKQKGTGNARQGDFKSPLRRGGGVIFGPRPRDYSYRMPRKALREALRSALFGKLRDGEIAVCSSSAFSAPSTKTAASILGGLGLEGSVAVVISAESEVIWKSFRNLPRVHIIRASDLNTYHVLWHRTLLMVDDAWDVLRARLAHRPGTKKAAVAADLAEAAEEKGGEA
jgi:large subunit ribosomal protein L4